MRTVATKILILVLTAALVASWLMGTPNRSYACSCVPSGTPTEELTESTAVFRATVTSINAPSGPIFSSGDPVDVTFRVDRVWKGPLQETLVATTARHGASCGYEFEEGGEYLVYARGDDSDLQVSLCSRTSPLSRAGEDLDELGQGRSPVTGSEPGPVTGSEPGKDTGPLSVGCNAPLPTGLAAQDLSLAAVVIGLVGLRLWRRSR